ncbi:flavin reductase family protein [Microbacterium sp. QXD-8]|jgi:flavin reductase (DIM6/NTAB) family NADH-FMN oxidoreductase RutF|uniref:Flavin reductase family protein n=2 Tax=Microbacterium TaxID=33882 RepID=A0ABU0YZY1_9MICO|nr:flavin reductase family protein [Microbacterium sp. QXD-8]MDQ7877106.1 flavin reductase family protein [Microbacterium sp. QXD-8]
MTMLSNITSDRRFHEAPAAALAADAELVEGISADEFRLAFRNHAAGVAVITADAGDGPVAMTATSVFSVSATPPLLVFSVSSLSSATPTILRSSSVVVHLLDTTNVELARLCATSGVDRFADRDSWSVLPTGEPYFVEPPVRLRGEIVNTLEAGTSRLIVVNVTHAKAPADDGDALNAPLVYHSRTWLALDRSSPLV